MADEQPPQPSSPWAVPGEGSGEPDESGYWGKLPASGRRDSWPPPSSGGPTPPPPSGGWTPPPPPGTPAAPPQWYGAPAQGKTEGLAIAAFVLGLVSLLFCPIITAIVGLVLAAKAHGRINQSNGMLGGRGLATAGRVLSIVGLVVWIPLIAAITVASINGGDQKRLDQLDVGDCFNIPNGVRVTHVTKKSCNNAHQGEVVSVLTYPQLGGSYPGPGALTQFAATRCPAEFARYVGSTPARSYTVGWLYPLESAWTRQHLRQVVCAVEDPDGHLVGSVRRAVES